MTTFLDAADPELPDDVRETVVTVGTFDGVHRGHLDVLGRLVARGRATGRPSLLLTFDPHPLEIVNPAAAPLLLTTRGEKLAALSGLELDFVIVLPFTESLAQLSAESFVQEILRAQFGMSELLIGHDHGFGRKRAGDVETLRRLGEALGFAVDVVPAVETSDGNPVSSTQIRRAIAEGRLDETREALGRNYSVRGVVEHGMARGRDLGFPTLNVRPESPRKLLPLDGVYAVRVVTPRGRYGGMLNLGGRPTFGEESRTLEAHLFEGSGDFYDYTVEVEFVARLRETRRFDGADALTLQLADDARAARSALTLPVEAG